MKRIVKAGLALVLALIASGPTWAEGESDSIAAVVIKVSPAVVRIISVRPPAKEDQKVAGGPSTSGSSPASNSDPPTDQTSTAIGSGFIIDPSGYIATNKHVVDGATSVFVMTADGERYKATFVGMPDKADMALIRINGAKKFPSVSFGDSDKMRVGDTAIAIGSPFGFDNSVTSGIISAVNRDIMESPFDDYLQTDAAINHGNSGGPLFNSAGEVIGMNSVIFSPSTGSSGLGFAIPSNELRFVFDRLMATGQIKAGMLPIHTQQLTWMLHLALGTPDLEGAVVTGIEDTGEKMLHGKLKAGDVILTFNGDKVWDPRDLARKAAQAEVGSDATLGLFRGGQNLTVQVTIHEWPQSPKIVFHDGDQKQLGLELAAGQSPDGQKTVTVSYVDPNGTAADSGIQKGDVILEVQQTPVDDPDQALRMFWAQSSLKRHFAAVLVRHDKTVSWMPLAIPN
jgi:serine protease Do